MTPPLCQRCGKPVKTFEAWFEERCVREAPELRDWGHKVTVDELNALVLNHQKQHGGAITI